MSFLLRLLMLLTSCLLAGGALWAMAKASEPKPLPEGVTPRVEIQFVKITPVRK